MGVLVRCGKGAGGGSRCPCPSSNERTPFNTPLGACCLSVTNPFATERSRLIKCALCSHTSSKSQPPHVWETPASSAPKPPTAHQRREDAQQGRSQVAPRHHAILVRQCATEGAEHIRVRVADTSQAPTRSSLHAIGFISHLPTAAPELLPEARQPAPVHYIVVIYACKLLLFCRGLALIIAAAPGPAQLAQGAPAHRATAGRLPIRKIKAELPPRLLQFILSKKSVISRAWEVWNLCAVTCRQKDESTLPPRSGGHVRAGTSWHNDRRGAQSAIHSRPAASSGRGKNCRITRQLAFGARSSRRAQRQVRH